MIEDFYGNNFKWFIGIVKSTEADGATAKVRIFGIHKMNDVTDISDGDLPNAIILMPTTGGQAGGGHTSHGLTNGTWVVGFFADGDRFQQPVIIGVLGGGYGSVNNTSGTTPSSPPANSSTPVDSNSVGDPPKSGAEKRSIIYNRLKELITKSGLSRGNMHAQISGILGHIMAECGPSLSNVNVDIVDSNGLRSHGICQWNGPRRVALFRFAGTEKPTLQQQVDFMWSEMMVPGSQENKALQEVMRSNSVEDAVSGFMRFERPKDGWIPARSGGYTNRNSSTFKKRVTYAYQIYNQPGPTDAGS